MCSLVRNKLTSNLKMSIISAIVNRFLIELAKNASRRFFSSGGEEKAAVTPLFEFHKENGGKMVNFGGFMLPVQYNDLSITNSHNHTRASCSLFDVSHMLQTEITGPNCIDYLEGICTADLKNLEENASTLTVFTNQNGGILDDLIITKINDDHLFVVSNAGRRLHDQNHLLNHLEEYKKQNPKAKSIKINFFEPQQRSLVALQGPKAAECLQKLTDVNLSNLYFMRSVNASVADIGACRITRCGYTGEDGFEISVPSVFVSELAKEILKDEKVKLAGLGARDSLRLEAGLCLYGSDISTDTTPIEAALTWLVSKRRRQEANFPGAQRILKQIKDGVERKRVGLVTLNGPPVRHGAEILNQDGGQKLGEITSGCPSPFLGKNIAMGYVPTTFSKVGTELNVKVRDKLIKAVVTKMPFVDCHYYTQKSKK